MNYADYQAAVLKNFADQGLTPHEGDYLSEAGWGQMSPKDQYDQMLMVAPALKDPQGASAGDTMPTKWLGASPDATAAFTARFGAPNGALNYTQGDPTIYGQSVDQWAKDPSRFLRMPDGTTVFEGTNPNGSFGSNVSGDFLRQAQATDDRTSNQFMTRGAATIGAMALAGGLMGSTPSSGLLSGDESAGLNMSNPFAGTGSGEFTSPDLFGGQGGNYGAGTQDAFMGNSPTPTGAFDMSGVTPSLYGGAIQPNTLMGQISGLLGGGSSLGTFAGQAGSGLLSGALSNPLQALGLVQMASGLIGGKGPSASTTSGSSKPQGGAGVPTTQSGQRPAWQPNQITASQLAQLYGGH